MLVRVESLRQMLGITEVRESISLPVGLTPMIMKLKQSSVYILVKWQVYHWKTLKNNNQI